jgi:hypothetical protein
MPELIIHLFYSLETQNGPGFIGGRHLSSQFPGDSNGLLHQFCIVLVEYPLPFSHKLTQYGHSNHMEIDGNIVNKARVINPANKKGKIPLNIV